MSDALPPIYFYVQNYDRIPPDLFDMTIVEAWAWQFQQTHQGGRKHIMEDGTFCWVFQTYSYLKQAGLPCELTGTWPESGIVIAYRESIPYNFQPSSKILLVCIEGDRTSHPHAQFRLVQNRAELRHTKIHENWDEIPQPLTPRDVAWVPLWSQPGLMKRNTARGNNVEIIGYFGTGDNLADELIDSTWGETLAQNNFIWEFRSRDQQDAWNDYREVDIAIAIRTFSNKSYDWKPATKLYNAWRAGVPMIAGADSAFKSERRSELDYIQVASQSGLLSMLQWLREHPDHYRAMVENGLARAESIEAEQMVTHWLRLIQDEMVPAYQRWTEGSELSRQWFRGRCQMQERVNAWQRKLREKSPGRSKQLSPK
jgi:hypothetical protein